MRRWLLRAVIALSKSSILLAQTSTGAIQGTISDQSGAIVIGARVALTEHQTNQKRSEATDANGFYQFQCQVPRADMAAVLTELLETVALSGHASMLSVLKLFGDVASPGLLSFPAPGATLAMDFANRGPSTLVLLGRLESIVRQAGGRLYPAKDAAMTAETYHASYPAAERFRSIIDPLFA